MTGYSSKADINKSDHQAGPSLWMNGVSCGNVKKLGRARRSTMEGNEEASTSTCFTRDRPTVLSTVNRQKQRTEVTGYRPVAENVVVVDVAIDNEARGSDHSLSPNSPNCATRPSREEPQSFSQLNISVQSPSTVQAVGTVKMTPDQDSNCVDKPEDLDEMILVQRKKKSRVKNSPPDSYKSDQGKQPKNKSNYLKSPKKNDVDSKRDRKHNQKLKTESSKPRLPKPASFDMENDFPPLSSGQLSPTHRRDNQVLYTEVIQKQKTTLKKDLEQSPSPPRENHDQSCEEIKVLESAEKEEMKMPIQFHQVSDDSSIVNNSQKDEESAETHKEPSVEDKSSNIDQKLKLNEESQSSVSEVPENQKESSNNLENKNASPSVEDQKSGHKIEVTEQLNEPQKTEGIGKIDEDPCKTTTANYILTPSADDPKILNKTKVNDQKFVVQNRSPNERIPGGFRPRPQQYQNYRRRNEYPLNPYPSNDFTVNGYMNGNVPIQGTSYQQNYQPLIPQTMYPNSAYYFAPNSPAYAAFPPVTPHHASGFMPDQSYIPIQGPFYSSNGHPILFSNGRPWEYVGGNNFNPEVFGVRPPFPLKYQPDPSMGIPPGPAYPQPVISQINQGVFPQSQSIKNAERKIPFEEMFPVKEFIARCSSVPLPEPVNDPAFVAASNIMKGTPQHILEVKSEQDGEKPPSSSIYNTMPPIPGSMIPPNMVPPQPSNAPERVDTLAFSPELQKIIQEAFGLQPNEGVFYVYTVDAQSNHRRQFRCFMHSLTPVKFSGLEFPVILEPTDLGRPNEHSPGGYYYVSREPVPAPAKGPKGTELVTQFRPLRAYSAIVPPDYRISPLPYYYKDLIRIPETDPRLNQDSKILSTSAVFPPTKNDAQ